MPPERQDQEGSRAGGSGSRPLAIGVRRGNDRSMTATAHFGRVQGAAGNRVKPLLLARCVNTSIHFWSGHPALFGTTFIVQASNFSSRSPTLLVGDHLLVNKFIF